MSKQRRLVSAFAPSRAIRTYLTVALLSFGCGSDLPEHPTYVSPQFDESCDDFDCSDVGTCTHSDEADGVFCECPSGYTGPHCEGCDSGFHRDALWHCVPDRLCADQPENPCGNHGDCKDDYGVIACSCADGYQGARCNLCAEDYVKSAKGLCNRKAVEK